MCSPLREVLHYLMLSLVCRAESQSASDDGSFLGSPALTNAILCLELRPRHQTMVLVGAPTDQVSLSHLEFPLSLGIYPIHV